MVKGPFIGALARELGLTTKAIRHYEALGLLAPAERTASGYRRYGPEDLERLRFIVGAKALGLSLAEIGEVLALGGPQGAFCAQVEARLRDKLAAVDRKIAELQAFRQALAAYLEEAPPGPEGEACRHVAGALAGVWQGLPPQELGPRP